MSSTPLIGKSLEELKQIACELNLPAFVGKQIADWIYKKQVMHIDDMRNLSKSAKEKLKAHYVIGASAPVDAQRSADGTIKYLYATSEGHYVETVFIPDGDRATLCVSSQVGCKMKCAFCMTGRQGFKASLTAAEIFNQIYALPERDRLTNIVFMGQGEPMDNLDAVMQVSDVLTADWGFGWSPKRITVSTVGLSKGLPRFLNDSKCHLAVSLHHPIPAERAKLMPAERAWSIVDMVNLLKQYAFCQKDSALRASGAESHQRRLSFEYIVFDQLNDSEAHAKALMQLLDGLDCRVNLIRFHNIPDTPLHGVDMDRMIRFRDYLTSHGLFTTIRASRGEDIWAACGLLSAVKTSDQSQSE